ncbi:hypothetical protein OMCYN_00072 [cyanobiont of Ornithocercus magnificus]|nr:hypothetical protein OMCYN_00072 [cyanobiont of Ornithocercus magnificus]
MTALPPPLIERCRLLLERWRGELNLSSRESDALRAEQVALDQQLKRLREKHLRLAVFGQVGVGKSSLLNALLGSSNFRTDIAHGCTSCQHAARWIQSLGRLNQVELIDTPGIDEISAPEHARLAFQVASRADLILLVLDGDFRRVDVESLKELLANGKPVQLVLNRCDVWSKKELKQLLANIRYQLNQLEFPTAANFLKPITVAAAPRLAQLLPDGRVRSINSAPKVDSLEHRLRVLLVERGEQLLVLNVLQQANRFQVALHCHRLRCRRQAAQEIIGRFAAVKAIGVAVNPINLVDLAGGITCDTALVFQLCQLYELPMSGSGARELLLRLASHNTLLGSIQFGLSTLRQLMLLAAPVTAGLSLTPTVPITLLQAALAIHTTRRTGRLTARELLRSSERGQSHNPPPAALMRRLASSDSQVKKLMAELSSRTPDNNAELRSLLP